MPLPIVWGIVSKKKGEKRDAKEISEAQQEQRARFEQKMFKVEDFISGKSGCNDLENALNKVNTALEDRYSLNEFRQKRYEEQKAILEKKLSSQQCFELKQQELSAKLLSAQKELSDIEVAKKEKQKKYLTYAGIGFGGLIALIVIVKLIRR
jgi:hypothetical protein